MKRLILLSAFALLFSGCGVVNADGTCRNYEPMDFCDSDQDFVCETTRGGCRHCTCRPRGWVGGPYQQWGDEY